MHRHRIDFSRPRYLHQAPRLHLVTHNGSYPLVEFGDPVDRQSRSGHHPFRERGRVLGEHPPQSLDDGWVASTIAAASSASLFCRFIDLRSSPSARDLECTTGEWNCHFECLSLRTYFTILSQFRGYDMKIETIAVAVPSRRISNKDVLDRIGSESTLLSTSQMTAVKRKVKRMLEISGSKYRFVRDLTEHEQAHTLICSASEQSMQVTEVSPSEIDVLIYCGVGRGLLEPANAYVYSAEFAMSCQCFDVADGCMSWVRSAQVAWGLFQSDDDVNRVLVVNGEFNAFEHGYPDNFNIEEPGQLDYKFPTYTIGEAATATIFSRSNRDWRFHFRTIPESVDLCSIPLPRYEQFVGLRHQKIGVAGTLNFAAFGSTMFEIADKALVELVNYTLPGERDVDIFFPHAASSNFYKRLRKNLNVNPALIYTDVYPRYGNIVSATIPMAIKCAVDEGRMSQGDMVCLAPASAGMVVATCLFEF